MSVNRKKKVCIYCQTWESGGIEAFINNILHNMDLSQIEVDIVVETLKESIFTPAIKSMGIHICELSGSHRKIMKNFLMFANLIDKRKYDVIHINIFQAVPLLYLVLAKEKNIPVRIAHSHNTSLRQSKTRIFKMWIHILFKTLFSKYATDLWACSSDAAKFMFPRKLLKSCNYLFVPNGINLERFRINFQVRKLIRKQLNLDNCFIIGNIGRLCYQKNQSFLLDIFAQVKKHVPAARLLLVGEGEDKEILRRKAANLQVEKYVIFYGTTQRIEELLWAMDVFVFPSVFEGLGIVAIEAQAAGLKTICSDKVPCEAIASNNAQVIPLSASVDEWERAIVAAQCRERSDAISQLEMCGYNIQHVGAVIEKMYLQ